MSPTRAAIPAKQNASTGPRTPAGKAASSQNALRHGLASGTLLIPGEDPAAWNSLLAGLLEEWTPRTPTERLLVEDLAKHHWLKERALHLQSEALAACAPGTLPPDFALLLRYQTTNERAFTRALHALQALQRQRREFVSQTHEAQIITRLTAPFPPFDPQAAIKTYRAAAAAKQAPPPAPAAAIHSKAG